MTATTVRLTILGSILLALAWGIVAGEWAGASIVLYQLLMAAFIGVRLRREAKRHPSRWS